MTIHSGFATRKQETNYNKCVEALVVVLFKRIIKFYTNESCDEEQFKQYLIKILSCMHELEAHKYAPPKYSKRSDSLCEILQIDYKSQFKQCVSETLQPKSSNINTVVNQIKRNYYRIYNCQKNLNKVNVVQEKDPSCYQNGTSQDNNQNLNNICFQRNGNTSQQIGNQNRQLKQTNKRGDSSSSQYKDKQGEKNRPKISSTQQNLLKNQEHKGMKISIKQKENCQEKEIKYQDYLQKYNEDYFKSIDQSQLEKSVMIQNNSFMQQKESYKVNQQCQEDEYEYNYTQNPTEMDYSDDSINMRVVQKEDFALQEEDQLMKNIEEIQNEQQLSFQSPFSFSPEKQYFKQKSLDQGQRDGKQKNESKQSRRYTKSKSALAYSLGVSKQIEEDSSNLIQQVKQEEKLESLGLIQQKSELNAKLSTTDENQSFAQDKIFKQKSQKSFEENLGYGTAYFNEQNGQLSSSQANQSQKSIQSLNKSLGSQKVLRQIQYSVDENDKKEDKSIQIGNNNQSDNSNKQPTSMLNVVIPGKKITIQEISDQFIKSSSPQFCQNQIDAIKQQLNMQTTYLQIQQQQLDKKMQHQQQELQRQLQSNQINQQKIIKAEQSYLNQLQGQEIGKEQSNQFLEESSNQIQIEEIQEEQEEEEESVFRGSASKKKNKIQQIQLKQLRKERLIQNSKLNKPDQNIDSEEKQFQFEDISTNIQAKNPPSYNNIQQSQKQENQTDTSTKRQNDPIRNKEQNINSIENNSKQNVMQDDNQKYQNKQIKRRIKILPCSQNNEQKQEDQQQQILSDISNVYQNKFNESIDYRIVKRCKTEFQHERTKIEQNNQHDKINKTIDYENEKKSQNSKIPTRFQNQISAQSINQDQDSIDRKSSIEPKIPSIDYNHIKVTTNLNGQKTQIPLSNQQKNRNVQSINTSLSPTYHNQQKDNNNNNQVKIQFKILKKKELSQSFRDQFGDSIKELSTEIYINSINSKKNEYLTPFWGEENKQNIKQTFSKQNKQLKENNQQNIVSTENNQHNGGKENKQIQDNKIHRENDQPKQKPYSFYKNKKSENNQQIDSSDKDITLSNILNGPYNPQHLNQLSVQQKEKKENSKSPKTKVRSYTSHSFTQNINQNFKQSLENSNALVFTQMPARAYYQPSYSNSPISTISVTSNSTNNKKLNFKNKQLEQDSYFKF